MRLGKTFSGRNRLSISFHLLWTEGEDVSKPVIYLADPTPLDDHVPAARRTRPRHSKQHRAARQLWTEWVLPSLPLFRRVLEPYVSFNGTALFVSDCLVSGDAMDPALPGDGQTHIGFRSLLKRSVSCN